jgi:hypothetical protein
MKCQLLPNAIYMAALVQLLMDKRAKQFTSNQCFGKTITYRKVDIDRYGRTVATVYLDNGRELN